MTPIQRATETERKENPKKNKNKNIQSRGIANTYDVEYVVVDEKS